MSSFHAYELVQGACGVDSLRLSRRESTPPGPTQVWVRLHAASLNHRDLALLHGRYLPFPLPKATIPLSDGAGEVVAVGSAVRAFAVGDRVMTAFRQPGGALGHPLDGVLSEYGLFEESGLLLVPPGLSFREASTLPVAAVTAWNALFGERPLRKGETVLILGTGGVALFALQFAIMTGASAIMTSSSDEKLERVKALGASATLNHASRADWASAVLDLTEGSGAQKVIELFGAATLPQSYRAVASAGEIALVADSTVGSHGLEPYPLIRKGARLRGIACGDMDHFKSSCSAVGLHGIRPVINSVYTFADAREAYLAMGANQHVGKIVIEMAA